MTPSKDGSQWLPGPEHDMRPRAGWVPNHPIYWTSVRTPWLSMTLALILDLIAIGAIVGGDFMALNGQVGPGVALLLGGLCVLAPLWVWGTIVSRRRFWSDR